jgi:hypothetical protein
MSSTGVAQAQLPHLAEIFGPVTIVLSTRTVVRKSAIDSVMEMADQVRAVQNEQQKGLTVTGL